MNFITVTFYFRKNIITQEILSVYIECKIDRDFEIARSRRLSRARQRSVVSLSSQQDYEIETFLVHWKISQIYSQIQLSSIASHHCEKSGTMLSEAVAINSAGCVILKFSIQKLINRGFEIFVIPYLQTIQKIETICCSQFVAQFVVL